jgi:DNA-binding response OmpR family regulator
LSETDPLQALAEQFGVPGIDLGDIVILTQHLDVIPREVCETHRILPVLVRGDQVFLAMANPRDARAIDELEFVTGKKVFPYAALAAALATATAGAFDARARRDTYYFGPGVTEARLRELGVDAKGRPVAPVARPKTAPPPVSLEEAPRAVHASMFPAGETAQFSTNDFGKLTAEVSVLSPFPADDEPPTIRGSAGRTAPGTSKLTLIVDDEEEIRTMLKRVFLAQGHRVIEADRGPLALRLVKQHMPDLIILDAMLPELHGFDVARRLKGSDKYGSIPIIMISAVYRGWRVAEDLKTSYGIFDYLEKPFRLAAVIESAMRALASSPKGSREPERDLEALSAEATAALDEGVAAYKAGNIDRAIELLKRGTEIDPLAYRLHFHLALLYGKKDQVFDSIGELEIAVELNPKHFPALKNLAVLYERAGFKNRALEMWERCVRAAPDDAVRAQVKERLLQLL